MDMKDRKELNRKIYFEYIPLGITFISIIIGGILLEQEFIKVLPVCVSLIINLLQARANRVCFLLGSVNSVIYIIGFLNEGLYGNTISAAFGIVIMMMSFFRWKRKEYKKATEFQTLSNKWRVLLATGILLVWGISCFVLYQLGGTQIALDGLIFVLGVTTPLMEMFAIIDVLPLRIIASGISLSLWIKIAFSENLANLTYVIYHIYCFYMVFRMAKRWLELYKEQLEMKKQQKAELGQR